MDLQAKKLENTLLKQHQNKKTTSVGLYNNSLLKSKILLSDKFSSKLIDKNAFNLNSKQYCKLLELKQVKNQYGLQSNLIIEKKDVKPNLFSKNLLSDGSNRINLKESSLKPSNIPGLQNAPTKLNQFEVVFPNSFLTSYLIGSIPQSSKNLVPNLFSKELSMTSDISKITCEKKRISNKSRSNYSRVKKVKAVVPCDNVVKEYVNESQPCYEEYSFSLLHSQLEELDDLYNLSKEKIEENEIIDTPGISDLKKIDQKNLNKKKVKVFSSHKPFYFYKTLYKLIAFLLNFNSCF